ncbi:phytanoyl-CoA dioxygenase family protein [Algirhabdus cladophorae]|uniref:phytanoyl-CoA dioxygenase family protein n=1 Tax=Algirhabdus cladophorae TaxID=3377108 RepID=UPI003B849DEA
MTSDLCQAYETQGFLSQSFDLANPFAMEGLVADSAAFEAEVATLRAQGRRTVPYRITDAIRAVAHDAALVEVMTTLLGSSDWVMWGSNIRIGTPNEAHQWHVDIESVHWPSITVAVGVKGCREENATRVISGSQAIPVVTLEAVDQAQDEAVLRAARTKGKTDAQILSPQGFGDGKFFVFDARAWHAGVPNQSNDRCILFMHYQRADALRVPQMKDYSKGTFFRHPAPFIDGTGRANPKVSAGPYASRLERLAVRWRL